MNRISFFSVCFLGIGSIVALLCTTLGFYKSVSMWIFTFLFVTYSVIHISMYYLQKQGETMKSKLFEKLRIGITILIIGWFLGVFSVVVQSSPQHTFKERIELWIERIKAI